MGHRLLNVMTVVPFESLGTVSYSPSTFHSNCGRICSHFGDIHLKRSLGW